jgi:hypothetical protein
MRKQLIVVSGGQTGVDQIALQVAHELGFQTGGFAPLDYKTEKGVDDTLIQKYKLFTCPQVKGEKLTYVASLIRRAQMNVDFSDGTIIIRPFQTTGTDKTWGYAKTGIWQSGNDPNREIDGTWRDDRGHRPWIVIKNFNDVAIDKTVEFIVSNGMRKVNIAGPRGSKLPHNLQVDFRKFIMKVLENVATSAKRSRGNDRVISEVSGGSCNVFYFS